MTINKGSTTPDVDMFEDFLEEKKCSYILLVCTTKVGTGCKEAGEKIMLVTFLVIYIY
jgi:hypothetical protein